MRSGLRQKFTNFYKGIFLLRNSQYYIISHYNFYPLQRNFFVSIKYAKKNLYKHPKKCRNPMHIGGGKNVMSCVLKITYLRILPNYTY